MFARYSDLILQDQEFIGTMHHLAEHGTTDRQPMAIWTWPRRLTCWFGLHPVGPLLWRNKGFTTSTVSRHDLSAMKSASWIDPRF